MGALLSDADMGIGQSPSSLEQFAANYPNPDAARAREGVNVFGKILGLAGLDESGNRARTSWGDAISNTANSLSVLNIAEDVRRAAYDAGEALPFYDLEETREEANKRLSASSMVLGGAAATGGFFAPKPKNTLGMFGGRLAKSSSDTSSRDGLGFTSQALEAAKALKQNKGTPEQMLKGMGPIKKAEIEATGLDRFLEEKKVVTKQQIINHLENNRVEVRANVYADKMGEQGIDVLSQIARGETPTRQFKDTPKYQAYSLSRDKNDPTYRETVVHLPEKRMDQSKELDLASIKLTGKPFRDLDPQTQSNVENQMPLGGRGTEGNNFITGHWPEPNIIAHYRSQHLKTDKGETSLNIDELQSDWGQKIREGGVRDEAKIAELKEMYSRALAEQQEIETDLIQSAPDGDRIKSSITDTRDRLAQMAGRDEPIGVSWKSAYEKANLLYAEIKTAEASSVGNPLVSTTDQWVNIGLKKIITDAVDQGVDGITITPGKLQVQRYGESINGEGMKYAYDNMYPKKLTKLLQKMDKSIKPERRSVEGVGEIVYIPLTQKVKHKITKEGQPLFTNPATAPIAAKIAANVNLEDGDMDQDGLLSDEEMGLSRPTNASPPSSDPGFSYATTHGAPDLNSESPTGDSGLFSDEDMGLVEPSQVDATAQSPGAELGVPDAEARRLGGRSGYSSRGVTVTDRGLIFPLATMSDGSTELAVPEIIHYPWEMFQQGLDIATQYREGLISEDDVVAALVPKSTGASALALPGAISGRGVSQAAKEASTGRLAKDVAQNAVNFVTRGRVPYSKPLPPSQAATPAAPQQVPAEAALASQRVISAQDAQDAARAIDVDLPGFTHSTAPVKSIAKQLSETPVIGAPVRNVMERSFAQTARAAENAADALHPSQAVDEVGATVQRGLDRFRNDGLNDIEAQQVRNIGIDPNSPVPTTQNLTRNAAREIDEAAELAPEIGADVTQTTRGATVPAARPRDQVLTARTTAEDLSDVDLAHVIRTPARDTSFATRSEALFERAWRRLPAMHRSDGSVNPNMVAANNTRHALGSIDNEIASQIAGQGTITGRLAVRLRDPQAGNFTLSDLRAIRTEVGRALGNTNPLQQTLNRRQLNQLYAAVSRDIENGLQTISARAVNRTTTEGNSPDRVTPEMARQAAGALRAFRTADRYFRQGQQRMEAFLNVVNASDPTSAAMRLVRGALEGGRGNYRLLNTAWAALRPAERNQVSALIAREMGRPNPSARGLVQELEFSPQTYVTNYQKMDPRARRLLFPGQHGESIDNIFVASRELANIEATVNTSRSATNALNMSGVIAAIASLGSGSVAGPATIGASGALVGYVLSRPAYARWTAKYLQMRAAVARGIAVPFREVRAHTNRLREITRRDPEMRPLLTAVVEDQGAFEDQRRADNNNTNIGPENEQANQAGAQNVASRHSESVPQKRSLVGAFVEDTADLASDAATAISEGKAGEAALAIFGLIPAFRGAKKAKESFGEVVADTNRIRREIEKRGGRVRPRPRMSDEKTRLRDAKDYRDEIRSELDNMPAPKPRQSVPSAGSLERERELAHIKGFVSQNPAGRTVKGRRGFVPVKEQQELIDLFFKRGGRLPPAPWGRNVPNDVRRVLMGGNSQKRFDRGLSELAKKQNAQHLTQRAKLDATRPQRIAELLKETAPDVSNVKRAYKKATAKIKRLEDALEKASPSNVAKLEKKLKDQVDREAFYRDLLGDIWLTSKRRLDN